MPDQSSERTVPAHIGLCPDVSHADEFYMPEPKPGETCPWCDNILIVYRQDETTEPTADVQRGYATGGEVRAEAARHLAIQIEANEGYR